MSNLNLKGIWIPIEILIDDNLSDKEKLIYSIILFLSKENKIKFGFYNSQRSLDLLQLCYNKVNDTIEIEFRDVMSEYIQELRRIKNKE